MLQQNPIVVEVLRQPPLTPAISYVSVLSSALSLVGVIAVCAAVVGLVVGGGFIWFKKRQGSARPNDPSHVRLRLDT